MTCILTMKIKVISRTTQFAREYKRLKKKHYDMGEVDKAITAIVQQDALLLSTRYSDHALKGSWLGYRELHIAADWLLIYQIVEDRLELVLVRTGSHDQLF